MPYRFRILIHDATALAQPATGIAFVTTQSAIALTRLSCVAPRFTDTRYW
ncbi:hypothetical protein [Nostoc sp. 'Peltigera membranacea cyanobiont' N6]|nr:hypothetical protein [Nostoc sp. 'Peltigera membranacea cyanobiont' N6]